MVQRTPLSSGLSGVAGEYFVAAELSRRGYLASITLRNARGIDILLSNADATTSVGIQVKTSQGSDQEWVLNRKVESFHGSNLFFVFVNLNNGAQPTYHIVPAREVAEHASSEHIKWLSTPGRGGRARADTSMRKFSDRKGKYRDRWELLGLGAPVA